MKLERLPLRPLPAAPTAPAQTPCFEIHGRPDPGRLRLAEGGELEGGPEGSDGSRSRDPHLPRARRTPIRRRPSPERKSSRTASSRRCAGASRRTIPPFPSPTGPSPISPATVRAASTRSSAGSLGTADAETIMLDGDKEAEGHPFFDLGGADHSPDHRLMAWSADIKGSEYFTIRVRDLESGADLPDEVPATSGRRGLARRFLRLLLRRARRQPPARPGQAPPPRHERRPGRK